ncbi:hypothetical protein M378DRAFT_11849 [Amanita muscaria Koide BX008]|uniref:Uncharacterized protein n=1 Tax=Amanita muscaria (strain Koide BX008) TaxID=946122 RepID=A0A0C2SL77_AMAMK|nr:hypothetical protein M378DRAFT_11849 [Amanita muscaria Koide BX008]
MAVQWESVQGLKRSRKSRTDEGSTKKLATKLQLFAKQVDLRLLDGLKEGIETRKDNLELNSITNPGIIEQYERRKEDASQTGNLEGSVQEKQKRANKLKETSNSEGKLATGPRKTRR